MTHSKHIACGRYEGVRAQIPLVSCPAKDLYWGIHAMECYWLHAECAMVERYHIVTGKAVHSNCQYIHSDIAAA